MTPETAMTRIDSQLSHVWMVRTFLKHSEEAEEEEELCEIHRELYDVMLALGQPLSKNDTEAYLRQIRKKIGKLKKTRDRFLELQKEVSGHMNFQMAALSLNRAVAEIEQILGTC